MTHFMSLASPIGDLFLVADDELLTEIRFDNDPRPPEPEAGWQARGVFLEQVAEQLCEYFAGRRRAFDIELAPQGTEFQRTVWRELEAIPFGTTISYGELARRIGKPNASRAVGAANGRNPIPIVIPCHRVVGSNGSLTGFGGGLEAKRVLLGLEDAPTLFQASDKISR